jgi:hypothetical protein
VNFRKPEINMSELIEPIPESLVKQTFADKFKHFLTRTSTQYSKAPLTFLPDRGIENRLLDNLLEFLPDGAVISGGFALSILQEDKNAKDIDFFFTNEKSFIETKNLLLSPPDDAWAYKGYALDQDKSNDRFLYFKHQEHRPAIQLLKMVWYDNAEHVIDSFDFTVIQFAFTNKEFVFNGMSFMDLARKRLVLHRMQFPASTMRRLIKYTQKGYYACPGSLVTICQAIQDYKGEPDIFNVVYVD